MLHSECAAESHSFAPFWTEKNRINQSLLETEIMTFSLYGLLTSDAQATSTEDLVAQFRDLFRSYDDFSLELAELPFTGATILLLRFEGWSASVAYEYGKLVQEDSTEIQRLTSDFSKYEVSGIDRRIRVVFGNDDEEKSHTDKMVDLMTFLNEIDGILVYDPQQNDFLEKTG